MAIQIQLRRDTAANWTSNNPILAEGEIGIETDTTVFKIGDGSTAWNSLGSSGSGTWTDSSTNTGTNKTFDDFSNQIEADQVHIQVRNESGSAMTRGQLVYVSGYNLGLDRYLVSLADADDVGTHPVIGILDVDISNNQDGHLTHSGKITDLDTSAFSVGDSVYMTTTPGTFGTRPSGTSSMVQAIGTVLRSNANNGVLAVVGAGRTNDIPNDVDHATDLQNVGTNTHAQIDTSITATGLNTTHRGSDGSDHSLSHAEAHTIASHSDTTATGAELETLTGGGDTTLHDHDGISENTTHRSSDGSGHADVASNTTHRNDNTQAHSDYLLNSATDVGVGLTLTGDNSSADTTYVPNVLYNTDVTPPTASTTPIGTIYIQYTA